MYLCHFQLLISSYNIKLVYYAQAHLHLTWVARLSTCWTSSWVSEGFFRNSFTMAVSRVNWTWKQQCSGYWIRSLLLYKIYTVYKPKSKYKTNLKTSNLGAFIMKALKETLQELISVVDTLSIFTHNPNHGSSSVWLIQRVQVFTQSGNYALIPAQTTERRFSCPLIICYFILNQLFL